MRVYFWIKGAPEGRPGGPWWFRDFAITWRAQDFIKDLRPYCEKIATTEKLKNHGVYDIHPPRDAKEEKCQEN